MSLDSRRAGTLLYKETKSNSCYTCNSNRVLMQKQPPATKLSMPKKYELLEICTTKARTAKKTQRSQFVIHALSLHKIQKALEAALNFWPCSNALHDFIPCNRRISKKTWQAHDKLPNTCVKPFWHLIPQEAIYNPDQMIKKIITSSFEFWRTKRFEGNFCPRRNAPLSRPFPILRETRHQHVFVWHQ